jgi:hypothetical protein
MILHEQHDAALAITVANELVSMGDRAFDEGREIEPYLTRAERILDAYEAGDDATALAEVTAAMEWLASA